MQHIQREIPYQIDNREIPYKIDNNIWPKFPESGLTLVLDLRLVFVIPIKLKQKLVQV